MPHRALVTSPLRGPGFDKLQQLVDVVYDPWLEQQPLRIYNAEQLAERIDAEQATVLIVETDSVKGPVLERPLVAIASTRGDPNNVDIPAATAAKIPIVNAPGRNADAVAEMAIALLFAINRRVVVADREVRNGEIYANGTIPYQRHRAWQLKGQTLGIVGLGWVGRALAWRAQGLGMRVISYDPYNNEATHESLDQLLADADVVSLHVPVTPSTTGMIGEREFGLMKDGAVFLNTARAQLHDTDALVAALGDGHLGGAGLDHDVGESIAVDHPLCAMDNVVLTPHVAGATYDVEANQAQMIADDLERILNGDRPQHLVNPEVMP
jgi:D-3-phosphoglycerate dehydrogenase